MMVQIILYSFKSLKIKFFLKKFILYKETKLYI